MSKKSRRLIRATPGPEEADAATPPVVEAPEPEWDFYFLPDVEPIQVDERELHDEMKLWRHGRATRTIGQLLADSYVMLFSVVVLGAMGTSVVRRAQVRQAPDGKLPHVAVVVAPLRRPRPGRAPCRWA